MNSSNPTYTYLAPGKYSVKDAAAILNVSTTRVIQLIYSGELNAQRTVNDAYLIDAKTLQEYKQIRAGNGRPWKAETAWAALWILSGVEADWLGYHQARRLNIRLKSITAKELVWLTRKRANTQVLRASSSFIEAIKNDLVLSGRSSVLLTDMGLTERNDNIEGYLDANEYPKIIERYHLVDDAEGNMVIRKTQDPPFNLSNMTQMPSAVVLVDLAASTDTREQSIAFEKLEELLQAKR